MYVQCLFVYTVIFWNVNMLNSLHNLLVKWNQLVFVSYLFQVKKTSYLFASFHDCIYHGVVHACCPVFQKPLAPTLDGRTDRQGAAGGIWVMSVHA